MLTQIFRLCAEELSKRFKPSTVTEICLQSCTRILEHYAARHPDRSAESIAIKQRLTTIQTRLDIIGRLAGKEFIPPLTTVMTCVFVQPAIDSPLSGNPDATVSFTLASRHLAMINPKVIFLFLSHILTETVNSVRQHFDQMPRLLTWLNDCQSSFDTILLEIVPWCTASPLVVGDDSIGSRDIYVKLNMHVSESEQVTLRFQ